MTETEKREDLYMWFQKVYGRGSKRCDESTQHKIVWRCWDRKKDIDFYKAFKEVDYDRGL